MVAHLIGFLCSAGVVVLAFLILPERFKPELSLLGKEIWSSLLHGKFVGGCLETF